MFFFNKFSLQSKGNKLVRRKLPFWMFFSFCTIFDEIFVILIMCGSFFFYNKYKNEFIFGCCTPIWSFYAYKRPLFGAIQLHMLIFGSICTRTHPKILKMLTKNDQIQTFDLEEGTMFCVRLIHTNFLWFGQKWTWFFKLQNEIHR